MLICDRFYGALDSCQCVFASASLATSALSSSTLNFHVLLNETVSCVSVCKKAQLKQFFHLLRSWSLAQSFFLVICGERLWFSVVHKGSTANDCSTSATLFAHLEVITSFLIKQHIYRCTASLMCEKIPASSRLSF